MGNSLKLIGGFLLLSARPISKLESAYGIFDLVNAVILSSTLTPIALNFSTGVGIAWYAGVPALLFLIAGVKLQWKLNRHKDRLPKIEYRLLPFPQSGSRIIRGDDVFSPQEGYAKIAIMNSGGSLTSCIGMVRSISAISEIECEIMITPLIFTAKQLEWDSGEVEKTIPNDNVERYLNLVHLDQGDGDKWQLSIADSDDYYWGWHKVDVVISSLETQMKPVEIEVAVGFGPRDYPPPGINLWPWDKWYAARMKELQQAHNTPNS